MAVLAVCAMGFLVAQGGAQVQVARRASESEAAYQARVRAAQAAVAGARSNTVRVQYIDKQADETDAEYLERLHMTIRGLLWLYTPQMTVTQRPGESTAAYEARCRAAEAARVRQYTYLIAKPDEDETAYRSRLAKWREISSSVTIARRAGESEAAYKARLRAALKKKQTEAESQKE